MRKDALLIVNSAANPTGVTPKASRRLVAGLEVA
jgi:hypothetical protein